MRTAAGTKKYSLSAAVKPAVLSLCALAAIWAAVRYQGLLTGAFSRGLSGDAAVSLLRVETSRGEPLAFSRESLLTFGSPLLAQVNKTQNIAETTGQDALTPPQTEPHIEPQPPVMTPLLPLPSAAADVSPSPADGEPSGQETAIWDDRVWPVPDEDDPGAHPLREVTLLPAAGDGSYITDGTVVVNNDTQYSIDVPALLAQSPKQTPSVSEGPQILILHTHGSESFLPDERDFYIPTDIERTEDTRYNVVRLGDELTARLEALGLTVIHDRDIHDYPSFSGAYNRALACIENYVKEYPTIQIVIDLHRDSISNKDGTMYKAVCETDYGKTAQMMFVVGTSGTGLPHDGWRDNLCFAEHLQSNLLAVCPTIMRPIHLRKERFNQHATPGSLILEVGTAANSLTEALRAVNVFCDANGEYLAELLLPAQ